MPNVCAKSFSSIRGRLVLSFILIALIAIGIVGGFSGALLKHVVERRESAYLQSNASTVAQRALSMMVPVMRPLSLLELVHTSAFMSDSRIRILDRDQRVLADSGPQDGSDHVWVRLVATFTAGGSTVRETLLVPVYADPSRRASLRRSLPMLERMADTQAVVVRRRGGLWGSFIEFQDYVDPVLGLASEEDTAPPDDTMRNTHVEPIGDARSPIGYVEIARRPDLPGEAFETIIGPFIIAALTATILAALLGLVFGRRLTAPIEGLTTSAVRMGSGDMAARAPATGSGEIGELGRQFNAMARKLESTVQDLRQERDILRRFVADASHELRTPVTALKTFNELLLSGAHREIGVVRGESDQAAGPAAEGKLAAEEQELLLAEGTVQRTGATATHGEVDNGAETEEASTGLERNSPAWRRPAAAAAMAASFRKGRGRAGRGIDARTRIEFLQDSGRQIERMEWIVENLLNLSRLESGVTATQAIRVSLSDLVRGLERRFAREAATAGVDLVVDLAAADEELELNSVGIEIALDNVMRNAIRYGGDGGEIRISAGDDHGWAVVRVRDCGPGIAPQDLAHAFDRFYRGKQVGGPNAAAGSGLGLAIAQAVVTANGGTITAANNRDGPGATFTLRLPLRRVDGT